jgi:hypothetical protein
MDASFFSRIEQKCIDCLDLIELNVYSNKEIINFSSAEKLTKLTASGIDQCGIGWIMG